MYSFIVIIFIEISQLGINIITDYPNKVCDIDDVIINMIGVMLMTFIIKLMKKS